MKKLIFVCAIFFLLSCNKEVSPQFSGSVSMKINGEAKQLNVADIFPFAPFSTSTFSIKFYDGNVTNLFLSAQKKETLPAITPLFFHLARVVMAEVHCLLPI